MSILIYVIIAMFGLLLGGVLTATVLRKYADKKSITIIKEAEEEIGLKNLKFKKCSVQQLSKVYGLILR